MIGIGKIKNRTTRNIVSFILLIVGTIISAAALECILIPNTILDGGVTGISIILFKLFKIPVSLLVLILNIPFVYVGYKNLGKKFLYRTIISMISFSLFLTFFEHVPAFVDDILLATVFGGALYGIGVGMVIHFGGCVDGTESVAIVISKKTSFSVGQIVLAFNLIIFGIAGFRFGVDRALYSLLTYFITSKVVDFVSTGLQQAKAAMIITEKSSKLSKEIYDKLGRTTTTISGEKEVLYCVLTRIEVFELKRIVEEMDESAFVTITDVSDIIGNHIKSNNKIKKLS